MSDERAALYRLQVAADESSKSGEVDVAKLLACHECVKRLVQRLLNIEQQAVRIVSLVAVLTTGRFCIVVWALAANG